MDASLLIRNEQLCGVFEYLNVKIKKIINGAFIILQAHDQRFGAFPILCMVNRVIFFLNTEKVNFTVAYNLHSWKEMIKLIR